MSKKRDPEVEAKVQAWIEQVTGEKFDSAKSYEDNLKDGVLICKLMNKIEPGSIAKIEEKGSSFVMRQNGDRFQKAVKSYGVATEQVFQTVDLFEKKNIGQRMCLDRKPDASNVILDSHEIPEIVVKCEERIVPSSSEEFDLFNSLLSEAVLTNDVDVCKKALNLIDTLEQLMLCSILNQRKLLEDTPLSQASICTQKELDRLTDRTRALGMAKKSIVDRMIEIESVLESKKSSFDLRLNDSGSAEGQNLKNTKGRNAIKVYFPNDFTTVIVIKPGTTLLQSLEKKFELFKQSDDDQMSQYVPDRLIPICLSSRRVLRWEMLLTEINVPEIVLEPKHDSRHIFKRVAVFLPPLLCSICHRAIFVGKRCCSCSFAIHHKCGQILAGEGGRMRTLVRSIYHLSLIPMATGNSVEDLRLRAQSQDIKSTPEDKCILRLLCNNNNKHYNKSDGPTSQQNFSKSESIESVQKNDLSRCDGSDQSDYLQPCRNRVKSRSQPSSPISSAKTPAFSNFDYKFMDTPAAQKSYHVQCANWEIMQNEIIRKEKKIGSGSFGRVYEAELLNHGRVAMKELNFSNPGRVQLEEFKNEVVALKKCRHKNIVSFLGYTSKPSMAIITEWCGGSSLYQYIHVQEQSLSPLLVAQLGKQICQGMCYLHSRDIIHRDLKSHNIFLHSENNRDLFVKIGDMGLATVKSVVASELAKSQPTGSIQWMAPEIIRMQVSDPYTVQSDAYAFGVVLYELVAIKLPYCRLDLTRDQILFMVGTGRLSPNVQDARPGTPKVICTYIERCCSSMGFHWWL